MGKEEDEKDLDDMLRNMDLSEKTELGEVAQNIFHPGAGRTNLTDDEIALCLINDLVFKGLNMDDLNPVDKFIELKKSKQGWSVNKMVESVSGLAQVRSGGLVGERLNGLFRQR